MQEYQDLMQPNQVVVFKRTNINEKTLSAKLFLVP